MKNFLFIFFIFFVINCTNNNNKNSAVLNNSDSINRYIKLADDEKIIDAEKQIYYSKAYELATTSRNDSLLRANLLNITLGYYKSKKWNNFRKTSDLLLKYSFESKDTFYIAQVYRYKANYYKNNTLRDSAFYFYLKAEKLFRLLDDNLNLGNILNNKSIVQYSAGDYVGADKSLTEAYSVLKKQDNKQKLYETLNMMGIISNETKDFEKAINYYNRALSIIKENNIQTSIFEESTILNNLGFNYQKTGKYTEAIRNYNLALKEKRLKVEAPDLYSLLLDNLAYSKFKLGDLKNSQYLFYESLKIGEQLDNPTLIVTSKIHLSEYYEAQKDTILSQKFANEALFLSKKTKITRDILISLKQLSNVEYKNASKYSSDYIRINDSIQDVERNSKEKFSRLELETDEIKQENKGLVDKNRTLLYIFIITVALASLLFVVRAQRARTRELLLKQAQQKANEEIFNLMMSQQSIIDESRNKEKKRLAQDLHDGILGRMFGLRLNLDSLNSSDETTVKEKRLELLNELKTIEQDIREISHDLNREKLVLINNFVSIVHNLLEEQKTLHKSGVTFHTDTSINWDKIGNAIKINLYRILQEGLQNINKYANANNIVIEINGNTESVFLKIIDDGIGFDVSKKSKGIGMQNMISRTNECQGVIDISSIKDKGTSIIITVPKELKQLNLEKK